MGETPGTSPGFRVEAARCLGSYLPHWSKAFVCTPFLAGTRQPLPQCWGKLGTRSTSSPLAPRTSTSMSADNTRLTPFVPKKKSYLKLLPISSPDNVVLSWPNYSVLLPCTAKLFRKYSSKDPPSLHKTAKHFQNLQEGVAHPLRANASKVAGEDEPDNHCSNPLLGACCEYSVFYSSPG